MQHNNTKGVVGRGEEVGINTRSVALRGRVGGVAQEMGLGGGGGGGGGRHCAKLKEQNKKKSVPIRSTRMLWFR